MMSTYPSGVFDIFPSNRALAGHHWAYHEKNFSQFHKYPSQLNSLKPNTLLKSELTLWKMPLEVMSGKFGRSSLQIKAKKLSNGN